MVHVVQFLCDLTLRNCEKVKLFPLFRFEEVVTKHKRVTEQKNQTKLYLSTKIVEFTESHLSIKFLRVPNLYTT